MGKIYLKDIRLHAFHGVLQQERKVGNDYVINVVVDYPFYDACISDSVDDTLNYADMAAIIKKVMAVPGNLLENVAYRMGKELFDAFPKLEAAEIDIRKIAPPMQIDCSGAGITLHLTKEDFS